MLATETVVFTTAQDTLQQETSGLLGAYLYARTTTMTSSPTIVNSPRRLQLPVPRDRSSSSRQRLSLQRGSAYLQDLVSRQREQQGYDREYKDALLKGEVGNGVRTWYSSYTTIGKSPYCQGSILAH